MFLFSVIDRAASLCSAKEHCGLLSLLSPSGLWTTYILESSWVAKSAIERLCACGSVCNCIKVHMHSQSLIYILWSCLGAYTHTHTHTHTRGFYCILFYCSLMSNPASNWITVRGHCWIFGYQKWWICTSLVTPRKNSLRNYGPPP